VTWIAQLEPVASAPAHLAGLLNLAGHMIPVLDLGRLLHNNDTLWTRYTPVILLAWADLRLGLITDELRDIEQLDIEPPDPLLPLPDWVVSCHPGPPARMLLDHGFLADSLHG
jgi:chemotaxis signal transduction protein